jgi:hypothetical protein
MSGSDNPFGPIVELHTENRADFEILDFAGSTGLLPTEILLAKNFIEDVLLVSPKLYQFRPSDGSDGNLAIGLEANLDLGRRIKAVGGEDAVVFGAGIGLGDIQLMRSAWVANDNGLVALAA